MPHGLHWHGQHMQDEVSTNRFLRTQYWMMLRKAMGDYDKSHVHATRHGRTDGFCQFMRDQYGLAPTLTDGNFTEHYNIVNEKKYMLFKIKYVNTV